MTAMKVSKCTPDGLCDSLDEFVDMDDRKPGFHLWRVVEDRKLVVKGVVLSRPKGGKRPILLNRCPFCEADLRWHGLGEVLGAGRA